MTELLNDEEIASRPEARAWQRQGNTIVRDWKFKDFSEAMGFVNRVAEAAEEANHHPDILVHGWNKVRLVLTNHSAGGLTEPDFEMPKRFDALEA
jgi:4a-hydroxytetrahydrobiopterin dehydratase